MVSMLTGRTRANDSDFVMLGSHSEDRRVESSTGECARRERRRKGAQEGRKSHPKYIGERKQEKGLDMKKLCF
jgi:hypothetical protein